MDNPLLPTVIIHDIDTVGFNTRTLYIYYDLITNLLKIERRKDCPKTPPTVYFWSDPLSHRYCELGSYFLFLLCLGCQQTKI